MLNKVKEITHKQKAYTVFSEIELADYALIPITTIASSKFKTKLNTLLVKYDEGILNLTVREAIKLTIKTMLMPIYGMTSLYFALKERYVIITLIIQKQMDATKRLASLRTL